MFKKLVFSIVFLLAFNVLMVTGLAQDPIDYTPNSGQARIYVENNYQDELHLDFGGRNFIVFAGQSGYFDLASGDYTYSVSVPSVGGSNGEFSIGIEESWLFQLNEGSSFVKEQKYPRPNVPSVAPSSNPGTVDTSATTSSATTSSATTSSATTSSATTSSVAPSADNTVASNTYAPTVGMTRIYLENNHQDEFFLDFGGVGLKVFAGGEAYFEVNPDDYTYSISVPSGGGTNGEFSAQPNESWLFQVYGDKTFVTSKVYPGPGKPEPATQPRVQSTPTPPPGIPTINDFASIVIPQAGRSRILFLSKYPSIVAFTVGSNIRTLRTDDVEFLDLDPSQYTYIVTTVSETTSGELTISADNTWLIYITEAGQITSVQLY